MARRSLRKKIKRIYTRIAFSKQSREKNLTKVAKLSSQARKLYKNIDKLYEKVVKLDFLNKRQIKKLTDEQYKEYTYKLQNFLNSKGTYINQIKDPKERARAFENFVFSNRYGIPPSIYRKPEFKRFLKKMNEITKNNVLSSSIILENVREAIKESRGKVSLDALARKLEEFVQQENQSEEKMREMFIECYSFSSDEWS